MAKNHLKTLAAPITWPIQRKARTFIARPFPGGHPFDLSVTLQLAITEILKMARTAKEVQQVLNRGKVLVDGRVRKNRKLPVGLFDVVSFPEIKQQFRIVLAKNGVLAAVPIKDAEAGKKLAKVIGKRILPKKTLQYNLSDGRNILAKGNLAVGDSVVISVPKQEIAEHLPLAAGATVLLVRGKRRGTVGVVDKMEGDMVFYKTGKENHRTTESNVLVVGKDKPALTIEGANE